MAENLNAKTDEELMLLYQSDNEDAFEVLYRRYSRKVYGFIRSRVRDSELGDEIFQSTFLKFHRSREQYKSSLPFAAFLFTICKSEMIDALRKSALVGKSVEAERAEAQVAEQPAPASALPDMSFLPPNQRLAIEMRYARDMNFQEIADSLQTSQSNVRKLISRGIKQMRELMTGEEERNDAR